MLIIIILFPVFGMADEAITQMHEFLFKCDLIAKAKIVSHTDHYYKIKIFDIFRNNKKGINEGDTIKIKKELNVITSVDRIRRKSIEDRLTCIAFLGKSEKGWGMRRFSPFQNERVTIRFGNCRITGSSNEMKAQIQEYFKEFSITNGELVGEKTLKQVRKSNLSELALIQYTRLYMSSLNTNNFRKIYAKTNCGREE